MTDEEEKIVKARFEEELNKFRIQGITVGAKTISTVVYEKVAKANRDCSKNDLLRIIKDVREFCETGLGLKDPSEIK